MCTDDDFAGVTCIDHFSVEELAAYHAWHARRIYVLARASRRCPGCGSPEPHLHPEKDGEVILCPHFFHRRITEQNTAEDVVELRAKIEELLAKQAG